MSDIICPYCKGPVFTASGLLARFICLNKKCTAESFIVYFRHLPERTIEDDYDC